jgi:hypothetical protein
MRIGVRIAATRATSLADHMVDRRAIAFNSSKGADLARLRNRSNADARVGDAVFITRSQGAAPRTKGCRGTGSWHSAISGTALGHPCHRTRRRRFWLSIFRHPLAFKGCSSWSLLRWRPSVGPWYVNLTWLHLRSQEQSRCQFQLAPKSHSRTAPTPPTPARVVPCTRPTSPTARDDPHRSLRGCTPCERDRPRCVPSTPR